MPCTAPRGDDRGRIPQGAPRSSASTPATSPAVLTHSGRPSPTSCSVLPSRFPRVPSVSGKWLPKEGRFVASNTCSTGGFESGSRVGHRAEPRQPSPSLTRSISPACAPDDTPPNPRRRWPQPRSRSPTVPSARQRPVVGPRLHMSHARVNRRPGPPCVPPSGVATRRSPRGVSASVKRGEIDRVELGEGCLALLDDPPQIHSRTYCRTCVRSNRSRRDLLTFLPRSDSREPTGQVRGRPRRRPSCR